VRRSPGMGRRDEGQREREDVGQNLLISYSVGGVRPDLAQFHDATTRTLLFHATVLTYMDELSTAAGFTSISWYIKPWHGTPRLGKAPRKQRGGWFKADDGWHSFDQLHDLLTNRTAAWRSYLRSESPQYSTNDEHQSLVSDVRAFRECLAGAIKANAGFYLFIM
jgi:hypothetical protein